MRKGKNLILMGLVLSMVLSLGAIQARAQGIKMGFVRDSEIESKYKAWQRAQEQWNVERKAWDDEAQTKQTELQDMIDEYNRQKLILSEDKKNEKEAAIRAKQEALDAYTRQIYGPGGTAEKKQNELIMPIQENVNKAIEAVATEEGYDVIFTMNSGLGYINPSYDVTDKVLEKLDQLE